MLKEKWVEDDSKEQEKTITFVILNEQLDGVIRIIKLTKNLGAMIDGVTETIKHGIGRQDGRLFALLETLGASLLESMSIGKNMKLGKGEIKRQQRGFLTIFALLTASLRGSMLTGKWVMRAGKRVVRAGTGHNNMDHMNKKI